MTGHINDNLSQNKITSQQWDFVVVQDNMGVWAYDHIEGTPGNANVTLANQIKANNSCTHIIYMSAWGPEGGVPSLGYANETTVSCINRVHENFINFNNSGNTYNEIVSPVGKSWIQSLSQLPSVDLYYSDNVHPSLAGSYLAAATIYASIFKKDPSSLSFTGGVNSSTASTMKNIAWSQVTNATLFSTTNLSGHTPSISNSGNQLTAGGFSAPYQWYLNGSPISGATSVNYTATTDGVYTVEADDVDDCSDFSLEFNQVGTGLNSNEVSHKLLVKTVSESSFEISSTLNGTYKVYDFQGKIVSEGIKNSSDLLLNLSDNSKGMYLFVMDAETQVMSYKLFVQ